VRREQSVGGYSTVVPSSIVRLTVTDHDRVQRLLRRVVAPGPSQERWRDDAVRLLRAHRAAEKSVLTPDAIRPAGAEALRAMADLSALDDVLDQATDRLAAADVPSPALTDLGTHLESLLGEHAATLVLRVLQPLEDAVARKEIRILGGRYDYSQSPRGPQDTQWSLIPAITWWQSEFVFLRLQGQHLNDELTGNQNLLSFQVVWAMGPHKHETY